jgi:hypothetical protein
MRPLALTSPGGRARRSLQRRAGEAFEQELSAAFALASARGLAWITKRPVPVAIVRVGAGGAMRGRILGSPGVDYVGVLKGGRSIFLEAKRCSSGTFALDAIEQPQWSEMSRVGPLGAARVLVVRWQPDTAKGRALLGGRAVAICVVPWSECERARDAREASLSAETLARYADTTGLHWVDRLASVDPLLRVVK